jgi:hypothetical protein
MPSVAAWDVGVTPKSLAYSGSRYPDLGVGRGILEYKVSKFLSPKFWGGNLKLSSQINGKPKWLGANGPLFLGLT